MKNKALLCFLIMATAAWGKPPEVITTLRFEKPVSLPGNVTFEKQGDGLVVEAPPSQAATVRLATIETPKVTTPIYALKGEIGYKEVAGDGYLEMWNVFPAAENAVLEQRYFSRTLADSGPLAKISGKSGWRPFLLPFDRTGTESTPTVLEFNLVLPKGGTVELRNVELVAFPDSQSLFGQTGAAAFPMWPVFATGAACAIAGTWLILHFRKRRRAGELRRMAAMDVRL